VLGSPVDGASPVDGFCSGHVSILAGSRAVAKVVAGCCRY